MLWKSCLDTKRNFILIACGHVYSYKREKRQRVVPSCSCWGFVTELPKPTTLHPFHGAFDTAQALGRATTGYLIGFATYLWAK